MQQRVEVGVERGAGDVLGDVAVAAGGAHRGEDGIAPDQLDAMYQPFVRGDTARRGGHGVGLTIVRRLSDQFGWPVTIDSTLGIGTRVTIRFPDARSEAIDR